MIIILVETEREGMERDNRLKRARDIIEGDEINRECKKLESVVDEEEEEEGYKDSGDAMGVFDFPWLKEGRFIAADEFHIDVFSPCFEIQDGGAEFMDNVEECCMHQLDSSLLLLDQDLLDYNLHFDDLDYCVWSSLIDQPLDVNVCINEA